MLVRPCAQNVPRKIGQVSPSGYSLHPRESGPEVVQGPGGMTTYPSLHGPVLVWSQHWDGCWSWGSSRPPKNAGPGTLPRRKPGTALNKWVARPTLKLLMKLSTVLMKLSLVCLSGLQYLYSTKKLGGKKTQKGRKCSTTNRSLS